MTAAEQLADDEGRPAFRKDLRGYSDRAELPIAAHSHSITRRPGEPGPEIGLEPSWSLARVDGGSGRYPAMRHPDPGTVCGHAETQEESDREHPTTCIPRRSCNVARSK